MGSQRKCIIKSVSLILIGLLQAGLPAVHAADDAAIVYDIPRLTDLVIDGKADDWHDAGFRINVMMSVEAWVRAKLGREVAFQVFGNDRDLGERVFNTVWYPATGTFMHSDRSHRIRLAERPSSPFASVALGFARHRDAWFSVIAAPELAGRSVSVRIGDNLIAEGKLVGYKGRARACVQATLPEGAGEAARFRVVIDGQATNSDIAIIAIRFIVFFLLSRSRKRLHSFRPVSAGEFPHRLKSDFLSGLSPVFGRWIAERPQNMQVMQMIKCDRRCLPNSARDPSTPLRSAQDDTEL